MTSGSVFSRSLTELDALFEQLPELAGPRELEDLTGGLTNRNVKVTTPRGVFVVRYSDANAEDLDIDRTAEHHNTVAAEQAGVGAAVIAHRPELGILVIGWLEGRTLGSADFRLPGVIPRAAEAIRRLHAGPRFLNEFDMFERQRRYRERCREHGFRVIEGYDDHADTFARIRRALVVLDEGTVPCNNDLLAENFIDDGDEIRLIDYDYSGNNDACFELGNTWTECRLDPEHLDELVTAYYGRRSPEKIARAHLQAVVSQYGWALWGFIQQSLSPQDYDFWQWGAVRFEGAVEEMRAPGFEQLLTDATTKDPA